jgi:DNA polymerase-3 subunit beta
MKFTANRDALYAAVHAVARARASANTTPILANVKIEAGKKDLRLTVTDMDIFMTASIDIEAGAPGATAVDVRLFDGMLAKLPDGAEVAIESEGGMAPLLLRCGRFRAKLHALPVEDFPDLPAIAPDFAGVLDAAEFARLLEGTAFAISKERARYNISGVRLHGVVDGKDSLLRAVATDGHRLACCAMPIDGAAAKAFPGITVPGDVCARLIALCAGENAGELALKVSAGCLEASARGVTLMAKTIDAAYPDYERVIPKGHGKKLNVNRPLLFAAVDRMLTVTRSKNRCVRGDLAASAIALSAEGATDHSQLLAGTEEVSVTYGGQDMVFGFNGALLNSILESYGNDAVEIALGTPGDPILIKPMDGGHAFAVLMPMAVSGGRTADDGGRKAWAGRGS